MISQHRHSGRYLPSRHTSYPVLVFMVVVAGALLLSFTRGVLADQPTSGAVGLAGTFMGEAPSLAPQILDPTSGKTFNNLPVSVRGSCISGLVVEVFKNGVLAGAANCQIDGSFSLAIDLFGGRNDLVARQYNEFNQASPDSMIVTIFYELTTLTVSQPKGKLAPAPTKLDQLVIKSDTAFKGLNAKVELEWPIEIIGGQSPYAVSFDWGDGQSSLQSLPAVGRVSAKHTYANSGNYRVRIQVTDASGQQAMIQVLTIVNGGVGGVTTVRGLDAGNILIAWPLFVLLILVLISFWLGEQLEKQKLNRDFNLGL